MRATLELNGLITFLLNQFYCDLNDPGFRSKLKNELIRSNDWFLHRLRPAARHFSMVEEHVTEVISYNVFFVVSILPILYKYLLKLKLELYFSIPCYCKIV